MRLPTAPTILIASSLALGGCNLLSPLGTGGDTSGTATGFTTPTLEVTVAGVHFGPAAPDTGSQARLDNTVDGSTGRTQQSVFSLSASSASVSDQCDFSLQRIGDGITPIGLGSYIITGGGGSTTPDGMVEPVQGEGVSVPQGTFTCTGDACSGGGFQITALDDVHVEGFLSGTFQSASGGDDEVVSCSFYVPLGQ